eukprot:447760-Pyramimonas_sp.AAC.1
MLNGGILPDEVNATVQAFLPNGEEPERGFIHRRNFGYNILELDAESRVASADPDAQDMLPVL